MNYSAALPRSRMMASKFSTAQSHKADRQGYSDSALSVSRYSTLGGTSA